MNVLVTGAAGFIGSNFVHHVLRVTEDSAIIALDKLTYAGNIENLAALPEACRNRLLFVKGDICDGKLVESLFATHRIEVVINFAAESHVDRSIHDSQVFLQTNVFGTHVLLDAAKRHWLKDGAWKANAKFVQISTDEVYGTLGPEGLFSERTPLDPHSPYSASKASADLIVKAYSDTFQMPICITRCSNNYGPYQFPEKLIPLMIRNALLHQKLPVYGDGRQVRDWLFVEDHCRAIELVWRSGRIGDIYNIGGNNEFENISIVQRVLELLRKLTGDSEIHDGLIQYVKDRLGHDRRYGIDATKIRTNLGWRPQVSFEEGITKTVEWYLANREWTEHVISGEYQDFYEKNYDRERQDV